MLTRERRGYPVLQMCTSTSISPASVEAKTGNWLVVRPIRLVVCLHPFHSLLTFPAMKKVKHRLVEKLDDSTADSLGLSRAVLVNGRQFVMELAACLW